MTLPAKPWRADATGVSVAVKVQPRARRAAVGGEAPSQTGPRLRIAVAEAAEDGRANRAACSALAAALGVSASAVELRAGGTSREKLLHVAGDGARLAARIEDLQRGGQA